MPASNDKKYKISKKVNDKWFTFGNFGPNQWGNQSLGIRVTPELRELLENADDGSWINFSAFEDDGQKKEKPLDTGDRAFAAFDGDEVPF